MEEIPEVRLGSALVSLVTPHSGEEVAFNKWYERDHYFAGCMIGANFFSGRRWVSTRTLRALSGPEGSARHEEYRDGSMLVLYWIIDGAYDATVDWAVDQVNQLYRQERMDPRRDNVYSGFCDHVLSLSREPGGVPVELALEHPYRGLFFAIVEKESALEPERFLEEFEGHLLPGWLERSRVAMMSCFKPKPLPGAAPKTVKRDEGTALDNRYLCFGFLRDAPSAAAAAHWVELGEQLSARGLGALAFFAPFIPTVPGSDLYMDEL